MNTIQLRQQLQQYIAQADDNILQKMFNLVENHFQSSQSIIGSSAQGEQLTQAQYEERIDNAEKDILDGNGKTPDEARIWLESRRKR